MEVSGTHEKQGAHENNIHPGVQPAGERRRWEGRMGSGIG
jgi:hypothetical protein